MVAQAGPDAAQRPVADPSPAEPPISSPGSTQAGSQASGSTCEAPQEHDPHHDSRKPIFHVMPVTGWGSDPNGPIYWKGRYHL